MNTNRETNRSETVSLGQSIVLSDAALDHVVGGLNPQPLPPGEKPVSEPPDPCIRYHPPNPCIV
jgi:hypothetical protein